MIYLSPVKAYPELKVCASCGKPLTPKDYSLHIENSEKFSIGLCAKCLGEVRSLTHIALESANF